jgi:hypothetical protein
MTDNNPYLDMFRKFGDDLGLPKLNEPSCRGQ